MIKTISKWKKAIIPEWCMSTYTCHSNKLHVWDEYGSIRFVPRKLCRFKEKEWIVSYFPDLPFAADLERLAANWADFKSFKATRDKIGKIIDWDDDILLAYETERKAERDLGKRAEIDKKYLTNYAN